MHFGVVFLEWKTLPVDRQITVFQQRFETVCTSFEVLCLHMGDQGLRGDPGQKH